ncbi:unnamed protein product [Hermetia illucens]|uniref:Citrate transporter-like domain-containing protein n=1 Tax=Hermetia illucens TaxID=343691 RepID=A0A7R8UHP8_HERIL|nr:P protein isoform X3 [Hermetia illucens]CAD7080227.1 unnamed protein product [Hermetia illucens]
MKVKAIQKRIFRSKKSRKSVDKFPMRHEVTEGALQVWRNLPEQIRHDPSLASFQEENERMHGEHDDDPLPAEDTVVPEHDLPSTSSRQNDITINITNELGEMKHYRNNRKDSYKSDSDNCIDTIAHEGIINHHESTSWMQWIKIAALLIVWGFFTGFLMTTYEKEVVKQQLSVPVGRAKDYNIKEIPPDNRFEIALRGAFLSDHYINVSESFLIVYVQLLHLNFSTNETEITHIDNITEPWIVPVANISLIDTSQQLLKTHTFDLREVSQLASNPDKTTKKLRIRMETNFEEDLPLQFAYDDTPIDKQKGVIYAAIVLLGLYAMIIWELVHRTFAAIIASTMSIGILAAMGERPAMTEIMAWIDVETLLLLFGMMIIVAILSETGVFDYLAVYAYKITSGRVWPLINCLCLFTAVMSSFLDNVTTVLLMTPVSIRLCEVMQLNPVPVLMSMIIYSNIGGALTPVGDPPNVIIASNSYIAKGGVNFTIFTLHMSIGVILVTVQTFLQLRFKFRNMNDLRFSEPQDVQELRHEISVWERAAASLSSYSKDEAFVRETLVKKVNRLKRTLKKKLTTATVPVDSYEATLEELQAKYPIRCKVLLYKSGVALVFVVSFFFLHSVPELQRLSLGWTALLGAILLLILADREDMEAVLARVEWSTLLFFAALFILMEALSELGLIDWIGKQTENIILSVGETSRLTVAILLILWVSAFASAFVDNIPLTTMMIKIAISLAQNDQLGLPLQPLVWALAFGACFGGNGTLIGASANVVCAGVAEQHGYRFTFVEYFKVGFPVMVGSIIVATAYLLIAHVVFQWH